MRSYSFDFNKKFFEDLIRLSQLNDMDVSEFITLILNHHFYRGGDIAYVRDEKILLLSLPRDDKNPLKLIK